VYLITVKNLIGFQSEYMTLSYGTGLMSYISDGYHPVNEEKKHFVGQRNGMLVSQEDVVEFINDNELVEITSKSICLRKRLKKN